MDQVVLSVRMKGDREGPQTGDVVLEGGAITNWAPGEFYKKDSVFTYGDQLWRATEDFTAGTTFDTDHCVQLGKADVVLRNFQPNTIVEKDNVITNDGKLYRAKNTFTTGDIFNEADWDLIGGGAYTFQSTDGTVDVTVSTDGKIIDFSVAGSAVWEKGTGEGSVQQKGTGAVAKGLYSSAEGELSKVTIVDGAVDRYNDGRGAHAEGGSTTAAGSYSHAEGNSTITNNAYEHAEGHFNVSNYAVATYPNAGNTIHSIGIGTNLTNRKNAVEVMQNGDMYILGIGNYSGTNITSADTLKEVIDDHKEHITDIEETLEDHDTRITANANNKRDKATGVNRVYTVNATGAQATSGFTTTPTASSFPVWTTNRTLKGNAPVDNNDLTNKAYVTDIREEIEDEFDKPFVKDFEPKVTASTLEFTKTFENIKTSATSTEDIALPVASGTQAGVMSPAIYNAIQTNADKIDAMLNGSVSIASLPASPTQAQLTSAWKDATGKTEVFNQAGIFDSTNNKIWTYYTNDNTWHYVNAGGATVSQWGTGVAGIVTGVADTPANRGRMFAEADGTASLVGYDYHETRITTNEGNIDNLEEDVEEIRDILDEKVDKTDSTYQVYATNSLGDQVTIQYSTDRTANSIARRIGNGRLAVGEPVNNTDATTKKYVDDQFEKVVFWDDPSTPVTPDPWITKEDIIKSSVIDIIYPVGAIFMSATMSTAAQVSSALGGTWVAWGAGKVPVGVNASETEFNTAEKTGGAKTHTLTINEMPSHNHNMINDGIIDWRSNATSMDGSGSLSTGALGGTTAVAKYTSSVGGNQSHNNLQPYITCYMYKRTA